MTPKIETQPFLGYYDDPAQPPSEDTLAEARRTARGHKLAGDLLVFLLASLLWLAAIFLLLPRPPAAPAEHGDSSCGSAAAAAATHARAQAQATAKGDFRVHNVTSGSSFVSCGNSTAEARRAGCQYDTLLTHWVPARCADQEWVDEYQDDDSWMAFADVNPTQRLSPEEMGQRDHYYTSIRDHVNHCAMLWRKRFWTLFKERRVFDGVIVNTYHMEHCAQFLSDLMTMNRTTPTLVRVGYSGCWVRDDGEDLWGHGEKLEWPGVVFMYVYLSVLPEA